MTIKRGILANAFTQPLATIIIRRRKVNGHNSTKNNNVHWALYNRANFKLDLLDAPPFFNKTTKRSLSFPRVCFGLKWGLNYSSKI